MAALERYETPGEISGTERALEVKVGSLGGIEVRPTRLFLWKGAAREETQRLVPLADRPVGLEHARRESTVRMGAVEVRSRGNPLMTLAMAGAIAARAAFAAYTADDEAEQEGLSTSERRDAAQLARDDSEPPPAP